MFLLKDIFSSLPFIILHCQLISFLRLRSSSVFFEKRLTIGQSLVLTQPKAPVVSLSMKLYLIVLIGFRDGFGRGFKIDLK